MTWQRKQEYGMIKNKAQGSGYGFIYSISPPPTSIVELEEDYKAMNVMFRGEAPAFDKLLDSLKMLEKKINSLY